MGLFKKSSFTSRSNKIDAFQSTVCEFGTPVPLLYGTCKVAPNLICYQDFTTREKRVTQKSGKSKSTTITYLYYVYVELALGEGIIDGVSKVWVGDTAYSTLYALNANSGNEGSGLSLSRGNDNAPTAYMSTNHADIATGYTNLAYLYGKIFLGEDNAAIPSYSFEVRGALLDSGDGVDANPAYVIRDILRSIGLGECVDEASFNNYADYCNATDLLISSFNDAFFSQKKAQEVIAELLEITNTYMFWSVDRFKFVPRDDVQRGTWKPNAEIIYDIDADELISQNGAPVVFRRKDSAEIYNYVTINFLNRANDYEEESVSFQDVASIKAYGVRSVSYDAKWLHTKERALKYARMKTRLAQTECNQYTLKLPWKYCRLEPGDLIRITDEAIGIKGQVAMVSEVTEANDGLITVTALQRAPGDYSEAKYKVDNKYQYQDFNIDPGDTARPLFIIPPSDLVASSSGCELWIALHGRNKDWGGCDVYVSTKDGDYSYNGTHGVSSVYGQLASDLSYNGDSVDIHLDNPRAVELLTGSTQDAADGNTLVWINGECMSYSLATLTGPNLYTLSGLVRAQYGTKLGNHYADDDVAILDGNIYALTLPKAYIGKKLYFKLPAFNAFKANSQDLSDLDCYTCVAGVGDLPNCTRVTAYNKYRDVDGIIVYHDIIVEWQPPVGFENYQQAQVWYKASTESKWQYGGQGYSKATLPQVNIGVTYDIAVCTQDIFGNTETPDASAKTSILVALSTEVPNTPRNVSISIGELFKITWDEVHNADIKYYEVRLDTQVGEDNSNFIARVGDASCTTNNISTESGTIYIFAVSAYGKVSAPATAQFSITKPKAPTITVTAKLTGIDCRVPSIPANCIGVHWYFAAGGDASDNKTQGNTFFKNCDAGNYEVRACYYTYFGDGAFSKSQMVHVSGKVNKGMIEMGAVLADNIDVDSLSAITATIGTLRTATTGARVEIKDDLIEVYNTSDVLCVELGVFEE